MVKKPDSYEEMLKKLETIVDEIDDSNLPLEDAVKKFQEGVSIYNKMSKKLEEAEEKVKILLDEKEEEFIENE